MKPSKNVMALLIVGIVLVIATAFAQSLQLRDLKSNQVEEPKIQMLENRIAILEEKVKRLEDQVKNPQTRIIPCN